MLGSPRCAWCPTQVVEIDSCWMQDLSLVLAGLPALKAWTLCAWLLASLLPRHTNINPC